MAINSYSTVAEADTYWADRGGDATWDAAATAKKEGALVKATEYIDTAFEWIGEVAETDQALSWPRLKATDHEGRLRTGVPGELKSATSWLAREALAAELDPAAPRGNDLRRVKAGSVEVEWNPGAPTGTSFRHVQRILKNIITSKILTRA